ncbi:hypothetical protein RUM44_009470 [Polyplax serrata]|uniref:non-specific serine/threonine protein kinase n=1 Tax=Polyplax serrata TaxID=468196 RepID=A0ABR1AU94_POLSC
MKKPVKFLKQMLCISRQDTMNSSRFSPRVTRSRSKRQQQQQQQTGQEEEQPVVDLTISKLEQRQAASVYRKNKGTTGKSKARTKVKNAQGEINSVLASRGSVGSISLLQTPGKCDLLPKRNPLSNLLSPKNNVGPSSVDSFRLKSPKIGTLSADTPERNTNFYKNIENISDCRLRILGKGSFGTAIQATYKGELVAAKVVPPHKSSTLKNELNNFFLSHPNIVKTLRVISNEENGSCGLVIMEMCSSSNLENLILEESYNLTVNSVVSFATDICRALDYCHSQRVLHLDVKPKNVLVNLTTNTCKLCDFGSSCLLFGEDDPAEERADYETLQSTAVYTSPELLSGGSPTDKSDVYSVGITLWQLVHRKKPYVADNKIDLQSTIYKVVKLKKRPEGRGKKNDVLENLYVRCWDHKPDKRPTMKEVVQYLENIPLS